MRFSTTLLQRGKTATGIEVPPEVVEGLDGGKRAPVRVTVNGGYTYRSTLAVMGGKHLLPFSAEHRTPTGIPAGDPLDVELELELDHEPRVLEVPDDLAAALAGDPSAQAAFDELSSSGRRRIVLAVDGAKTTETRTRRIARSVADLAGS